MLVENTGSRDIWLGESTKRYSGTRFGQVFNLPEFQVMRSSVLRGAANIP